MQEKVLISALLNLILLFALGANAASNPQGLIEEDGLIIEQVSKSLRYVHDPDKYLCFIEYTNKQSVDVEVVSCNVLGRADNWRAYFYSQSNKHRMKYLERTQELLNMPRLQQ